MISGLTSEPDFPGGRSTFYFSRVSATVRLHSNSHKKKSSKLGAVVIFITERKKIKQNEIKWPRS